MSSQHETADASILDYRETHSQERADAAEWSVTTMECECGADITEWHAPAQARRLVRIYGGDGTVPACPACQAPRSKVSDAIQSVPKAMAQLSEESSVERVSREERVREKIREYGDGDD